MLSMWAPCSYWLVNSSFGGERKPQRDKWRRPEENHNVAKEESLPRCVPDVLLEKAQCRGETIK